MKKSLPKRTIVLDALETYERRLVRYAAKLLGGDLESARDIVQQAFLKLCQQDCQAIQHRMAPWLFTVCRNLALDERKRTKPAHVAAPESFSDDRISPDEAAMQSEDYQQVVGWIDRLPERQREAIELWASGLNYREISEVVSSSEGAIRVLVHRAITRLKEMSKTVPVGQKLG
jgi:RNA polymerase sigma-70 factor (ECF subfamily)